MATVDDLLARKGTHVYTVPPRASVLEAVRRMNEYRVGALVVMDDYRIRGIFTERDVLRRVVADERLPSEVRVQEVMSEDILCVRPGTPVDQVARILKDRRIRHLPVCDEEGRVLGLVSIGDVNAFHASDQEATIHLLNELFCAR
ncbi:MAG: CBS domain-containing protein [Armatimonadota bacterium]